MPSAAAPTDEMLIASPPAGRARKPWWMRPTTWAVAGFVATRIYFYVFFSASISDVGVYFDYVVQGVDYGRMPYQDVESETTLRAIADLEYPPVAYWIMALPRELSSWRMPPEPLDEPRFDPTTRLPTPAWKAYFDVQLKHYQHYDKQFRAVMLAFDIASFALLAAILRRRRPKLITWVLWGYTLCTSLLGYVLLERLDVVLTFFFVAWAYCRLRADDASRSAAWLWTSAGYASLGLGIAFKLIPVLAVPFALWSDVPALCSRPRDWKRLVGPAVLVLTSVLPFAYYYRLVGDDLWNMFRFHTARGVQIESSYATWMMLTQSATDLICYFNYGSWNLGGAAEAEVLRTASWLLPAALVLLGVRALAAPLVGERFDGVVAMRYACVAVPVATLLSKVFSVQYLLWAAPLALLSAAEYFRPRAFKAIVVLTVAACALTGFLFPHHYLDKMFAKPYSLANPPPFTLIDDYRIGTYDGQECSIGTLSHELPRDAMIARNVIFAAVCTALFVAALRPQGRT